MPNIKSSKKNVLRSAERQVRNKSAKSAVKTAVKKSRAAIAAGDFETAASRVHDTQALINKTASRGIIHKNAASRRTSRLMKRLAAAQKPEAAETTMAVSVTPGLAIKASAFPSLKITP